MGKDYHRKQRNWTIEGKIGRLAVLGLATKHYHVFKKKIKKEKKTQLIDLEMFYQKKWVN